jgi:hypothetical protein
MRPEFAEHDVLAADDLEDERVYLNELHDRHLASLHPGNGRSLVAARVEHPDGRVAIGLGDGTGADALAVTVRDAVGRRTDRIVVAAETPPATPRLAFTSPAPAPPSGPAYGTLSLLAGVGQPAATELRIENPGSATPGRVLEFRLRSGGAVVRPLSIAADGTVTVEDLRVTGRLLRGPAPVPAGGATPDATGSVAAAEALRRQLTQGLGIGADAGIRITLTNASVTGGRVRFTVEVRDAQGVAPVSITIRGRVNVGTSVVADDLGLLPAQLQVGQVLRRPVDIAVPAAAKGDVIVAVTAFGVHPHAGLVNASVARLIGTIV